MIRARTFRVGGSTVTVRELTLADVRAWFLDLADGTAQLPEAGVVDLADLARMSSLDTAGLAVLAEADITKVAEAAIALNPDFFGAGEGADAPDWREAVNALEGNALSLARLGYGDLWRHPYGIYLRTIEHSREWGQNG